MEQNQNDPDHIHFNVVEQDVLTLDLTVDDGTNPDGHHHMSVSRAIVGGLMLPPMASLFGRLCFSRLITSTWQVSAYD